MLDVDCLVDMLESEGYIQIHDGGDAPKSTLIRVCPSHS